MTLIVVRPKRVDRSLRIRQWRKSLYFRTLFSSSAIEAFDGALYAGKYLKMFGACHPGCRCVMFGRNSRAGGGPGATTVPEAGARTIFLTGATGFIGGHLLDRLIRNGTNRITCLTRSSDVASDKASGNGNVEWITGELARPATYADALSRADVVIHLAAATGAASVITLRDVNYAGTQALLAARKNAAAGKIVYVSSIAVTGSDVSEYPYAQTKLAAEKAVQDSGLDCVIVRPTIVLGEGAPNWRMLRRLACLPVVPLFGGARAEVQPVDVIDVARGLEWLADNQLESGSIVEIGGPEVLQFSAFLARIRAVCGRDGFPHLSIPMAPVRMVVKMLTRLVGARSPVGPGQLAPFVNDAVAKPNAVFALLRADMLPLDELLQRVLRAERSH